MKNLHLHIVRLIIQKHMLGDLLCHSLYMYVGSYVYFVKFIFINYIKKLHDQMQNEGHSLQAKH
jgi:hypothetical protein